MIKRFLQLCKELGIPVSMEKIEWASEMTMFLGILLDGRRLLLAIPEEKRVTAINMLQEMSKIHKKKVKVKDLQHLCGYLNFICKAILPGRTFVQCMYAKFSNILNVNGSAHKDEYTYKLEQHHHIKLDKEFKLDCKIWLEFLSGDLGEVVYKPMIDFNESGVNSREICFYSDASALPTLGFCAILRSRWIQAKWDTQLILREKPSIEFLELFALCAGIFSWEQHEELKNGRVTVWCYNMAVVHMINSLTSGCEKCMRLLRLLVLNGLKNNHRLTAFYVTSKDNFLSDALSRGQMERFHRLGPHMNEL